MPEQGEIYSRDPTIGETLYRRLSDLGIPQRAARTTSEIGGFLTELTPAPGVRQFFRGVGRGDPGEAALGALFALPIAGKAFKVIKGKITGTASAATEKRVLDSLVSKGSLPRQKKLDFDLTFSKGVTHKKFGLDPPKFKFDRFPQTSDTMMADVTKGIPLPSGSQRTGFFDPPFVARTGDPSKIKIRIGPRFTVFRNVGEAKTVWRAGVSEGSRILAPGGKFLVKIQDTSFKGKHLKATDFIIDEAEKQGLRLIHRIAKKSVTRKGKPHGLGKFPTNYLVFEKLP